MALLNQFQSYSQKENTVTNNALLMFSRLYQIRPQYYEDYIAALIEDSNAYRAIPDFSQQVKNYGDGIIDGLIQIAPSKIIIETKLSSLEFIDKLLKYTKSFKQGEVKILLHLSNQQYSEEDRQLVEERLPKFQDDKQITFISKTYEDLVLQLEELASVHPHESQLQYLTEDFRDYCEQNHLIADTPYILRAMACNKSYDLNIEHGMYFDIATRGYRPFKYLGIYKNKSVRAIGEIENNIEAGYSEESGLEITRHQFDVTPDQKRRLTHIIKESIAHGWDVHQNHRFFLLKNFHETDFPKISPNGIFRVRYFNLKNVLGEMPNTTSEIATELRSQSWE